jgi:hypothetical protein
MMRLGTVGVAMMSCLLAAPSFADEFTDSLSAIRRAMVGPWSGSLSGVDAQSGEEFRIDDDAFTFVITGNDGLDSATWSADLVEIATYEDDARYRIRSWNRSGEPNEIALRARVVEQPDASGNGAWRLEGQWSGPDGTLMDARETFKLHGDTLTMRVEMRRADSADAFETTVTGIWSRQSD